MHDRYMREALALAEQAARAGEVPVGAIVVAGEAVVGRGFNQPIAANDPTAHAEIAALRAAGQQLANYRLAGAALYVTVEPCLMCVGAMLHARIGTLVFGATEPKTGAIESTMRAHELGAGWQRLTVVSGVLATECREALRRFFQERRM
jgi:tRNA(adenine34) deaminase